MKKIYCLFCMVMLFMATTAAKKVFCWYDGEEYINYSLSNKVSPVVATALEMLTEDMKDVTGASLKKVQTGAKIHIVQLNKDKSSKKWLLVAGIDVDWLSQQKDAFHIKVHNGQLLIVGSDGRGTAYGILELP